MFKSLIIICLSTFLLLISSLKIRQLSAQNPSEKKAEILLQRGLIKLLDKNYQQAMINFNQALEINPNYEQAYYQRGLIYAKYAQGIPPQPNEIPAPCFLDNENQIPVCPINLTGKVRNEHRINALNDLEKTLKLNPNYAPAYYQKGLIYQANQQPKEAKEAFQKATHLYSRQGLTYLQTNQPQQGANFLNYSNLSYQKIKTLSPLNSTSENPSSEDDIGGSTLSPEGKKSPEDLFEEACNLVKIPDYVTALEKFRQAARLFARDNNQKRYQETQTIIQALAKYQ